ncbi:hypothetical protein BCR36DRAFT_366374 [Piromyces finnis]|uniref:Uncharacterized protein n=1 Tax=Piromyces finnis TaxID=1754191 RepID=A0A1Y1VL43_9FUNG|nr:hypothetical protein BCR36DRAFT_366374 [Piromyces finnis]|eukprot:ORX59189.1 hypothetical protein BCR36DRAFT_366374 [Piromyces finnis]
MNINNNNNNNNNNNKNKISYKPGKEESNVLFLVGNSTTNEKSEYLINNIKNKKYQLNGWLYYNDANFKKENFTKYSKIRLERLSGITDYNIDCSKVFFEECDKELAKSYSSKPIRCVEVFTYNELDSSIIHNEINFTNSVT